MKTNELLLPLRTAAKQLAVQPENLQKEVEAGTLPSVRVGDQFLYPVNAIRAALLARIKAVLP